jgi:hypothetical protein
MATATVEKPTTEKNASGRSWSAGPYVRKGERDLWNRLYETFVAELKNLRDYPAGPGDAFTDEGIDVAAYNLAYEAIWELRED